MFLFYSIYNNNKNIHITKDINNVYRPDICLKY